MKWLIGCEFSQAVTLAFRKQGIEAFSCDLLPTEGNPEWHYQEDIFELLKRERFDRAIFFPPCTDLAVSGAKHFAVKIADGRQKRAIDFVQNLMNAPVEKWALENPVGVISSKIRKPDQIIQPWMFGHEATKTTCLWLNGLPNLIPTNIVGKGERHVTKGGNSLPKWYNLPPSADRWKIRSATFQGIADGMASQWGGL